MLSCTGDSFRELRRIDPLAATVWDICKAYSPLLQMFSRRYADSTESTLEKESLLRQVQDTVVFTVVFRHTWRMYHGSVCNISCV